MDTNSKIESLGRVPLFSQLSRRELSALAAVADEVDVPAGATLAREGVRGQEFLVIADGLAEVESGGEILSTLGSGSFFGEIALVTGGPRTATVTARAPSRLFILTRPAFRSLLRRSPRVARTVLASAALRVAS
jgi:CRP/FNR family transcriptional regulator, cyclic AMP receptor protein